MTLDELNERADELGLPGDTQLIVHEPGEGFFTIEGLDMPTHGTTARLQVQADTFFENEETH